MKVTLMGVQTLDFTSGKDVVDGTKIYLAYSDPEVIGFVTTDRFLSSDKRDALNLPTAETLCEHVGCEISVDFNAKGKVAGIELLGTPKANEKPPELKK